MRVSGLGHYSTINIFISPIRICNYLFTIKLHVHVYHYIYIYTSDSTRIHNIQGSPKMTCVMHLTLIIYLSYSNSHFSMQSINICMNNTLLYKSIKHDTTLASSQDIIIWATSSTYTMHCSFHLSNIIAK